MIKVPAERPPELLWLLPGVACYRLEPPPGFPFVDSKLASMFRELEVPPGSSPPAEERATLLESLATTIMRATYHRRRFGFIIDLLNERSRLCGRASGDTLGNSAVFEASAMLGAVRGAVDEIVYLAARISGATEADADAWAAYRLVTKPVPPHQSVPGVLEVRARERWFLETNDYRNALVHRGVRKAPGTGYYPRHDVLPEARDPGMNLFLVPDRASIQHHARPHLWTYQNGLRLEDLVERTYAGFEGLLSAVGAAWGFTLPDDGTAPVNERPNMMVRITSPVLTMMHGRLYAALFTTSEHARRFMSECFPGDTDVETVPVHQCHLGTTPRFILNFLSGTPLRTQLKNFGSDGGDYIKIAVDPIYKTKTGAIDYKREAGSVPIDYLLEAGDGGVIGDVPADLFPGHEVVYVIRTAHQELPLTFKASAGR